MDYVFEFGDKVWCEGEMGVYLSTPPSSISDKSIIYTKSKSIHAVDRKDVELYKGEEHNIPGYMALAEIRAWSKMIDSAYDGDDSDLFEDRLRHEVDNLFLAITNEDKQLARQNAILIGALAVRFLMDYCDPKDSDWYCEGTQEET